MLGGNQIITFDPSLAGKTITLTQGELELSGSSTITIDGGNQITVSGGGSGSNFSVFKVDAGTTGTLENLTISNGFTNGDGGGIDNAGTLSVSNCTISGNSTNIVSVPTGNEGGGIFNSGSLTVINSTISGNACPGPGNGGGIMNDGRGTANTNMTIINSTISGNTAGVDGGIQNIGATMTVINSTISGNSASFGGGIGSDAGVLTIQNVIVAGNAAVTNPDIYGTIASGSGNNIIGIGTTDLSGISNGNNGNQIGTSASPINTLLAPLGNNGGNTQTMALLPGSPAIDAGNNSLAVIQVIDVGTVPLETDQRGAGFPRILNTTVDIGAFELNSPAIVLSIDRTTPATAITSATSVSYTVTFDENVNNVLPADFKVVTSGTVTVDSPVVVTPVSGSIYTVTVNGIQGSGDLRLDLIDDKLIFNDNGPLAGAVSGDFSGQTYSHVDTDTTVVNSSLNPSLVGQTVDFTATVSPVAPGSGTPTGPVTFFVNGKAQSPIDLDSSGQAILSLNSLTVGTYSITATYGGDPSFAGSSTAVALMQTVNQSGTSTTLATSPNPALLGETVTLKATVTSAVEGGTTPTGSVTFAIDGVNQTPIALNAAGQVTLSLNSLANGTHTIVADYTGSTDFAASSSDTQNQLVFTPADPDSIVTKSEKFGGNDERWTHPR